MKSFAYDEERRVCSAVWAQKSELAVMGRNKKIKKKK